MTKMSNSAALEHKFYLKNRRKSSSIISIWRGEKSWEIIFMIVYFSDFYDSEILENALKWKDS
jgi:hypothetical protein